MIELTVQIRDKLNRYYSVPFYLHTWVPVSHDGAKPIIGGWSCTSPYLGKGYTGKYHVKMEYNFNSWHDDPSGLKMPNKELRASFFDIGQDLEFMRLGSFDHSIAKQLKLMGVLLDTYNTGLDTTLFWWAA